MIYTFPSYVRGIAIAVAALAAAIGALLLWRRKPLVLALIALGVSALAGGIIAPTLALDRVVLDDQEVEQTTGLWFAPTVKGFRLTDVTSVTISTTRGYNELWIARMKDGHSQDVDPGDLWEMNGPDIIERLRAKGIQVIR
jgi:hypothetical protein